MVEIFAITQDDLRECAALYCEAFTGEPWNEPWHIQKAYDRLNSFLASEGFVGLMAVVSGEIVGIVVGNIEPFVPLDVCYVRDICVKSGWRHRGVGTTLIDKLHGRLRSSGIGRAYLLAGKGRGTEFYVGLGYQYDETMEVMCLNLDGTAR